VALVTFFVKGEPRPKQSFRVGRNGGYTHPRVKAWQIDVATDALQSMREIGRLQEPFKMELSATLLFTLGDDRRVDLDNLSKAVLDGLNGIVYEDDRQIIDLHLRKTVRKNKKQLNGVHVTINAVQE
jgi:Holliday junction resolvase RusA-like endonuclease